MNRLPVEQKVLNENQRIAALRGKPRTEKYFVLSVACRCGEVICPMPKPAAKPQPPLSPRAWRYGFKQLLVSRCFEPSGLGDSLISRLLADPDTLNHAAEFVRLYVTNAWTEENRKRAARGKAIRRQFQEAAASARKLARAYDEMEAISKQVEAEVEIHRFQQERGHAEEAACQFDRFVDRAAEVFSLKRLGVNGDAQTLTALNLLLIERLGLRSSPPSVLSLLVTYGNSFMGREGKDAYLDPEAINKKLARFRTRNPVLYEQTRNYIRALPRS